MNLSELQQEIGRLLNDADNTRWSASILTTRINEAQTIVQGYTRALKTDDTLTPTANTQAVTLDADTMDIIRVVIQRQDGDQFQLEGTTEDDLDFDYPNWRNLDAGEPKAWFYKGSNQTLNLVPKPDANNAISNGLIVTGIHKPPSLSASSDIPFNSNNQLVPYHMSIVHWVVAQCYLDDGTPEALAKSKFHRSGAMARPGEFETQIMRILAQFDSPQVPTRIKFRLQGGRIGPYYPSKTNPLA